MTNRDRVVRFRAAGILPLLALRSGSPDLVVKRDITRYYWLMTHSVPVFTPEHARRVYDKVAALQKLGPDRLNVDLLHTLVAAHVEGVTPVQALALLDACDRATLLLERGWSVDDTLREVEIIP